MKDREAEMNSMKRGAGVPHVSGEALSDMEFIIPSIDRQKEIVATLDRFNGLCNDLNIGLPAEIEARTKQYEFYRDQLLTFAESGKTILTTGRPDDRTTGRADDRATGGPARRSLAQ